MKDQASVLRETDGEALTLARTLLRSARYAGLAVLDPATGFPFASRVLLGTDIDGIPVVLVSALSAHTKALENDPRASLLTGEPGKGDPLAYARLTTQCVAEPVERGTVLHDRIRARFLNRHSKAKLYIDFPDFRFFRLVPQAANLNGGFGRAYLIEGADLAILSPANDAVAERAEDIVRNLVEKHPGISDALARFFKRETEGMWRICGLDCGGFEAISGDFLARHEFDAVVTDAEEIIQHISKIAY